MSTIKTTTESKNTLEIETDEELTEVYLQLNLETLDANRALFDEADIDFYIKKYGHSPFRICKRRAGAETYACSKIRVSPEAAAISKRVDQWSGKRRDRERREREEAGITLTSLESLYLGEEDDPIEYDIPDSRDTLQELLHKEKTRAIIAELSKAKSYYPKIFGWLYLNCCTPARVAEEIGIARSTAHDDIKRVQRIAAEVYHRFE